ncbi:hypothetical protein KM924_23285 [Brevibacillus parabrevis]|uniref:hypothetical protein n=1 Tax=Brevibacillus parabrevis TaxID=54914 RepID=UPI001C24990C|nr:hypothetical protein [Brevibacillus parabrevis]MBU8715429.1 hypothetical protein [Brevibacillus parabrevis]
MKTTEEQRRAIFFEEDAGFEYEKVEETDWEDGGKYSSCEVVFKTPDGKFYMFPVTRSGSYFSHYEYEFWDEVEEVEKVTRLVEVTSWEAVSKEDDALSQQ